MKRQCYDAIFSSKDCFGEFILRGSLHMKAILFLLLLALHPQIGSLNYEIKDWYKQAAKIKLITKFTHEEMVHEAFLFINFREYWYPGSLLVGNLRTIIWNILKSVSLPGTVMSTMWHPRAREINIEYVEEKENHFISSSATFLLT